MADRPDVFVWEKSRSRGIKRVRNLEASRVLLWILVDSMRVCCLLLVLLGYVYQTWLIIHVCRIYVRLPVKASEYSRRNTHRNTKKHNAQSSLFLTSRRKRVTFPLRLRDLFIYHTCTYLQLTPADKSVVISKLLLFMASLFWFCVSGSGVSDFVCLNFVISYNFICISSSTDPLYVKVVLIFGQFVCLPFQGQCE